MSVTMRGSDDDRGDTFASELRRGTRRAQGAGRSRREVSAPHNLSQSRWGLRRTVCEDCVQPRDDGLCRHEKGCPTLGNWITQKTGPLTSRQTSLDTGWFA